jgi:nitrite reductase/ring-hydroxylating ferredoxin subunit
MYSVKNQTTQPIPDFPVFNNWEQVAVGWYFALPSRALKPGAVTALQLCGQELVLFRTAAGTVAALDAYCPHMGTHLGRGRVVGEHVRCFFHHWEFGVDGACAKVPCQPEIPARAKLRAYTVREKFGAIWVYPGSAPAAELADFPDLPATEALDVEFGASYERSCHHHVTMINGLDPQHLKTVHALDIEMAVEIAEASRGGLIDITLTGKIGAGNLRESLARFLFGETYSYSMRYDHGNNGLLTLMKDVAFRGRRWPSLHMIFAYRPVEKGRTLVQPIYLTRRRRGIPGRLLSRFLLWLTKRAFFALQGEDGAVYENMRFYPGNLLPIDGPVGQYIQYVNKLEPSPWKLP